MAGPRVRSRISTKEIDHGFKGIIKELEKLEKKPFVKVGYPAELKPKDALKKFSFDGGAETDISDEVTVLDVAIWMEFGTEVVGGNIPERSFIRSAFDKNLAKYEKRSVKLLEQIYSGLMTVERALDLLGLMLENDIKDMIRNGDFKELAESTKINKGSDKPLIDTAQMLNAIRFKRFRDGRSALGELADVLRAGSTSGVF